MGRKRTRLRGNESGAVIMVNGRMSDEEFNCRSGLGTHYFYFSFYLFLLSFFFVMNSHLAGGCSELLLQLVSLAVVDLGRGCTIHIPTLTRVKSSTKNVSLLACTFIPFFYSYLSFPPVTLFFFC